MRILAILLLLIQTISVTASELEMIELHNRPAEEIVPLIKPLLDNGESISGRGFQLILKADTARQAQIRELVKKLDRAAAQLMISVFQGSQRDLETLGIGAGAHYQDNHTDSHIGNDTGTGKGAEITLHGNPTQVTGKAYGTRARLRDKPVYRLRVTEGSEGYIETGKSIPYFSGQVYQNNGQQIVEPSVTYKDVTSGFYVRPRLSGDRVILDISPQRNSLNSSHGGAVNIRRATTTISGRPGEWIPLGGTTEQAKRSSTRIGKSYSTQDRHSESIWIKADIVK